MRVFESHLEQSMHSTVQHLAGEEISLFFITTMMNRMKMAHRPGHVARYMDFVALSCGTPLLLVFWSARIWVPPSRSATVGR